MNQTLDAPSTPTDAVLSTAWVYDTLDSEQQGAEPQLDFGLHAVLAKYPDAIGFFGIRGILERPRGKWVIDVPPGRTGRCLRCTDPEVPLTKQPSFTAWQHTLRTAAEDLDRLIALGNWDPREGKLVCLADRVHDFGRCIIEASTNGSCGYLYITLTVLPKPEPVATEPVATEPAA